MAKDHSGTGSNVGLSGEVDEYLSSARSKRIRISEIQIEGTKTNQDPFRTDEESSGNPEVRVALFSNKSESNNAKPVPVTPYKSGSSKSDAAETPDTASVRRKLIFGRWTTEVAIQPNVKAVYKIIRKLTGSLGGNASHGPIYGELTMGSMQKVINLMKEHASFNSSSRFIDVGSGIGKPSLHVAQDPGVLFSYGIEVEPARWMLGQSCLGAVLKEAARTTSLLEDAQDTPVAAMAPLTPEQETSSSIQHRCFFELGDIREASSFDPFTHVYMFSIGYVRWLSILLSDCFSDTMMLR
jgi:Histone methylation protein DOT1